MFFLRTSPGSRKTFQQFVNFLYARWVKGNFHYTKNIQANTIHVVFDLQSDDVLNPKVFERMKRDQTADSTYDCVEITDNMKLPTDFQIFLHNRHNKHKVVHYICDKFLQLGMRQLNDGQTLIIGGGFKDPGMVKIVTTNHAENYPKLQNNHFEGDTMVWLHAAESSCNHVIVYSSDNAILCVTVLICCNQVWWFSNCVLLAS